MTNNKIIQIVFHPFRDESLNFFEPVNEFEEQCKPGYPGEVKNYGKHFFRFICETIFSILQARYTAAPSQSSRPVLPPGYFYILEVPFHLSNFPS